jgi:hypothetical protein
MRARVHRSFPETKKMNERLQDFEASFQKRTYELIDKKTTISAQESKERIKKEAQLPSYVKNGKPFWYYFDAFVAFKKKSRSVDVYRDGHYSLCKQLKVTEAVWAFRRVFLLKTRR